MKINKNLCNIRSQKRTRAAQTDLVGQEATVGSGADDARKRA